MFHDQQTGPASAFVVDAFAVDEFASAGGSMQLSPDSASGGGSTDKAREGLDAAAGGGVFGGAGKQTGYQWAFGGLCGSN